MIKRCKRLAREQVLEQDSKY